MASATCLIENAVTLHHNRFKLNGQDSVNAIGVPIYIVFDLLSNTIAAYDLFHKHIQCLHEEAS